MHMEVKIFETFARKSRLNQVVPVRDERVEYFRNFDREQDTLTALVTPYFTKS